MSEYVCSQCGCGFPASHGKKRVHIKHLFGDPEEYDSRIDAWTVRLYNVFFGAFNRHYKIVCPECGHTFGE